MKKLIAALLCAACLLALCACTRLGSPIKNNSDGSNAKAQLKKVIEAVNAENKEALKALFSKKALEEAADLDERMDYLFNFVEGEVSSWKAIVAGAAEASNHYGHKTKKSRSWYSVKTDKEEYLFFLLDYPVDTENPDNIGLYMLQVVKMADSDTQFDGGQKILCAGIYKPEETTGDDAVKAVPESNIPKNQGNG